MSNIKRIQDYEKKWNMFRIFLNNDSWRNKYKICFLDEYNILLNQMKNFYPMCYNINEMFHNEKTSIIYGSISKNIINANITTFDFENKTDLSMFGEIVGLCVFCEDFEINSKLIIYYLRFVTLFECSKGILFVRNKTKIEAYLINPKLTELYNNGLINFSKSKKNKIYFKKNIEIFQKKCGYSTIKKEIEIELFIQPLSLIKN